jgi:MOSC domain-containing protein YiiM
VAERTGIVVAVNRSARHTVSKVSVATIVLRAGFGVEEDAHAGATIEHRYAKRFHPERPNERQVHLIGGELFDELERDGFHVEPGQLGENITTRGIALTDLPLGTRLRIANGAVVEVRGLRVPCVLIDRLIPGVKKASAMPYGGKLALRHGIMGIVIASGSVQQGDVLAVEPPAGPARALPFV